MNDVLNTKSVAILITQKCTLHCKLCGAYVNNYKNPVHTPKETVFNELDKIFEIFDYIEFLDITGGEPLMHPDIAKIIAYALKYSDKFTHLRITTNGTLLPSAELIDVSKCGKVIYKIDDYGDVSLKVNELQDVLAKNNITFRTVPYHGEQQYCNGWIYFGDHTYKDYSSEQLDFMFDNCYAAHWICLGTRNGKLHICTYALVGAELGTYTPKKGEYIDLFDETIQLEEKRKIAKSFGTKPLEACKYCNGFDTNNSPRFPAAEQI